MSRSYPPLGCRPRDVKSRLRAGIIVTTATPKPRPRPCHPMATSRPTMCTFSRQAKRPFPFARLTRKAVTGAYLPPRLDSATGRPKMALCRWSPRSCCRDGGDGQYVHAASFVAGWNRLRGRSSATTVVDSAGRVHFDRIRLHNPGTVRHVPRLDRCRSMSIGRGSTALAAPVKPCHGGAIVPRILQSSSRCLRWVG